MLRQPEPASGWLRAPLYQADLHANLHASHIMELLPKSIVQKLVVTQSL